MRTHDVVTIGSAVQDILFGTNMAESLRNPKHDPTKVRLLGFEYGAKIKSDDVHIFFGGGAANTAVVFARLGLRVAAMLRVGTDAVGSDIIRKLKAEGVDTQYRQEDAHRATGFSFILKEQRTNEHVVFAHYGANTALQISPATLRHMKTKWFYVSSLSHRDWPRSIATLQRTKAAIAWNPGAIQLAAPVAVRRFFPRIAVLILNRDEATELCLRLRIIARRRRSRYASSMLARALVHTGVQNAVVTDGINGAVVCTEKKLFFDQPPPHAVKDTTGAGDAFGATFIASLIRRPNDIPYALRLATLNATAQVMVPGAQKGLLTWQQLTRRMR